MRVLLAVHSFPPRSHAGVEVYTFRLAQALGRLGHDTLVLTAVHDLAAKPYTVRRRSHEGVDVAEVVSVHHVGTLEASYRDPGIATAADEVLDWFRPDCVHVQHLLNLSASLIPQARARGAFVTLTLHDYYLSCPRDGLRMRADLALCESVEHRTCASCLQASPYLVPRLQRRLAAAARWTGLGRWPHRFHDAAPRIAEALLGLLRWTSPSSPADLVAGMDARASWLRRTLDDVNLFLAPTAFVRDRTVDLGVRPDRILVVPYGAVVGPTRPRPAAPRRRLGFVGTLAPHKGVHVLIEAFRQLEGSALTLDIHGSPSLSPSYSDQLRRITADDARVRFRGGFAEGEQERVFANLDLLVVPSIWWENSPLTVLEALAAGVPVVGSRTGGLPELIEDGRTGLLVPPRDPAALRRALEEVVQGRQLAEALPPLPLKTATAAARELVELCVSRPALRG